MIDPTETDYIIFGSKRCSSCGERLPACRDFFAPSNTTPDCLTGNCRRCRCDQEKARLTRAVRDHKNAWARDRRARRREVTA